jgi:hypothetical protein
MPSRTTHIHPSIGSMFQHKYGGTVYSMIVVQTKDGIGYKVGEQVYKSPTAAAKSIVGKEEFVNGRSFWHMNKSKNNTDRSV